MVSGAVEQATADLAAFVARTSFADLPETVRRQATLIAADTIGVAIRGSMEPEMAALRGSMEPEMAALRSRIPQGGIRGATVLTGGFPTASPPAVAFANATAICFLELDEGTRPTGHPALHVFPAALALAQHLGSSGQEFLTALVVGYEVQARIQRATRLRWAVHPHGNFGHLGAVAALGKLAGWTAEQIRQGLTSAAALAMATSWQPCLVGATVRNAYPGLTAQTAFTVKLLVESGFTGYDGAVGETFGELLGESFDATQLTERLGDRWAVLENYFKFHAACALNHPVLDALANAVGGAVKADRFPPVQAESVPAVESIVRIVARVPERFARLDVQARPNQLSAKFSIPFAAAAFLLMGRADLNSFSGEALSDPRIRRLAQRVEVITDPELSARWPAEAASVVTVTLTDGRVLTGSCSNPYGSALNPPHVTALAAKFAALTEPVLAADVRARLWRRAIGLESAGSLSDLFHAR